MRQSRRVSGLAVLRTAAVAVVAGVTPRVVSMIGARTAASTKSVLSNVLASIRVIRALKNNRRRR